VSFDEAKARLIAIARQNGGVVTSDAAERDEILSTDRSLTSAAAHALASATNVFGSPRDIGWFPYAEIRFTDLR
jgi:hypothetical protein